LFVGTQVDPIAAGSVSVGVNVTVGVNVLVAVKVIVGVSVFVGVKVIVGVSVIVEVGVKVGGTSVKVTVGNLVGVGIAAWMSLIAWVRKLTNNKPRVNIPIGSTIFCCFELDL
jgi:hypothetical protein